MYQERVGHILLHNARHNFPVNIRDHPFRVPLHQRNALALASGIGFGDESCAVVHSTSELSLKAVSIFGEAPGLGVEGKMLCGKFLHHIHFAR